MNACCEIIRGRPLLCRPSAGIQEALLCLLGVVLLVFCDWHPLVTISLGLGMLLFPGWCYCLCGPSMWCLLSAWEIVGETHLTSVTVFFSFSMFNLHEEWLAPPWTCRVGFLFRMKSSSNCMQSLEDRLLCWCRCWRFLPLSSLKMVLPSYVVSTLYVAAEFSHTLLGLRCIYIS